MVMSLSTFYMSVSFDNIGFVQQLIEKIILSLCGVKNARPFAEAKTSADVCLRFSKTRVFQPSTV